MCKFRIVEIKKPGQIKIFIPEYKTLIFWYRVSDSRFYDTIYRTVELKDYYAYTYQNAQKIIDEFKCWIKANKNYIIIHKVT